MPDEGLYKANGRGGNVVNRRIRPGFADDVYGSPSSKTTGTSSNSNNEQFSNDSTEMCVSALAQRRSAQLPKLKELSIGGSASVDCNITSARQNMSEIDFKYADCDKYCVELAELYTYSEMEDFALNYDVYFKYMEDKKLLHNWINKSHREKSNLLQDIAQRLESADSEIRLNAARILLYILQGSYGDFAEIEDNDDDELQSPQDAEFSIGMTKDGAMGSAGLKRMVSDKGTGGNEENCLINGALNSYIVYEAGLFQPLCTMLLKESQETFDMNFCAERTHSRQSSVSNSRSASNVDLAESFERRTRKSATLADNESLRVVINSLYHMLEAIRREELIEKIFSKHSKVYSAEKLKTFRESFIMELDEPLESIKTPLVIFLFDMMPSFVRGTNPHYPIKKVLLLCWKVLLATLGDLKFLREEKARKRKEASLGPVEDTLTVASRMKPTTSCGQLDPEAVITNLSRMGRKVRSLNPARPFNRQTACSNPNFWNDGTNQPRDGSLNEEDDTSLNQVFPDTNENEDDEENVDFGNSSTKNDQNPDIACVSTPKAVVPEKFDFKNESNAENNKISVENSSKTSENRSFRKISSIQKSAEGRNGDQTPKAVTPIPHGLMWSPKVNKKGLENFLNNERQRFFGYKLAGDLNTLFGLPLPCHKSVEAFKRNIYVSLGDLQIEADEKFNKFPFTHREFIEETTAEKLYRRMLPNMTEYVIALLKVILASLPSSKAKSDAVTILSDVLTPETDTNEMLSNSINLDISSHNILEETVRVAIDINRHKELIVKAASAIIITILKFFRLNHIYQFENFSQYLVLANCLPLVLKFLDQNICRYFQSKHELSPFNYPQFPLYYVRNGNEYPILNAENVDEANSESPSYYLWRNVFSSINLLRVLNKLTKWKHARTMMLVVFKSAPVLKRCMRVKLGIFQLYVLKLLKMQARYLGRQWRKSNMDLISSIYLKVRHRLNDDWAFANETRSKSWDFQMEEGELGMAVKTFNCRRYRHLMDLAENDPFLGKSGIDDMDMRDFEPVENSLQKVLSWQPTFSDRFRQNYSKWVDEEVINRQTNWDSLLNNTKEIMESR